MSPAVRVGINGFGRMGRLALRAGWGRDGIELVHVNEVRGGPGTGAHLLEFDSVHGRRPTPVGSTRTGLVVDGRELGWSDAPEPAAVDWAAAGVDVVLECTGRFRSGPTLTPYLERGVRTVVVAAPVKDGSALNVVVGGTQAKVFAWYDNEWGYANRLVELTAIVARSLESS
jgi:glyceraldehyde-3-phosphate dehydrogenase (arsenate-transferring)